MSFIAKNPLTISEVESPSRVPRSGTRGIFAGRDGWYDIDSNNKIKKIATTEDIGGGSGGGMTPEQVEQLEQNTEDIVDMTIRLDNTEAAVGSFDGRLSDMGANISSVETTLSETNSRTFSLGLRMDSVEEQIGDIESALEDIGGGMTPEQLEQLEQNTQDITDMKERVTGVEAAFGSYNEMLTIFDERISGIDERCGALDGKVLGLGIQVGTLEEQIGDIGRQIGDIESALDGIIAIQNSYIGGDS